MTNINGDMLRGHLENLILSSLKKGDAHGFEILKRLEEKAAGSLTLKEGSLYPALYRLESAGLVKAAWEENDSPAPARKGPRRRIYHLTSKGGKRLEEAKSEWSLFVQVISTLMGAPT